ncbi:MAG: hypothetical protein V2B13_06985 [Pseudomonadota bacterium]
MPTSTQKKLKIVKTVRFEEVDLDRIKFAARREQLPESEIIRKAVHIGLVDLLDGENEDDLLRRRMADHSPDIDGESFLKSLKKEFGF